MKDLQHPLQEGVNDTFLQGVLQTHKLQSGRSVFVGCSRNHAVLLQNLRIEFPVYKESLLRTVIETGVCGHILCAEHEIHMDRAVV